MLKGYKKTKAGYTAPKGYRGKAPAGYKGKAPEGYKGKNRHKDF